MASVKTPLVDEAVQKEVDYGAASAMKRRSAQGAPPATVTTKGPDGKTTIVRVAPKMSLFGLSEPPGGWYGPFGFLRMVAIAFTALSGLMVLTFAYAIYTKDNTETIAFCLLLAGAALLAAGAAYSHEGLANQVSAMAKRNNKYSALNDKYKSQTDDLQSVADKVNELLEGKQETLEEFKQQMAQLDQLSSLNQVSTLTRAFIDAQMNNQLFNRSGDSNLDGLLQHSEVVSFLSGAKKTLQDGLPNYNLDDLGRAAFFPGMSLTDVNLLLAAVNTESQQEKANFMALLFFFLDPHKAGAAQEVTLRLRTFLNSHEKFGNEAALKAEIVRLANTCPKEGTEVEFAGEKRQVPCRVPPKETRELASVALHTFAKDEDDDLEIDDE